MINIMWKYPVLWLFVCLVSCTGAKNKSEESVVDETEYGTTLVNNLQGQWAIENIVENDSMYVRPSEIEQGFKAYIDFKEDNKFGVMTNCNHIDGQYHQVKDSIHLSDISTTELACDNMELEEMLKKILPMVNAVDCINDSVARLNSDKGDTYIVLKKRKMTLK